MHETLLCYLLNALEEDEARRVEEMLAANEAVRQQLELLRLALLPLGTNQRHDEPPQDLAARTCQLVRENRQAGSGS